MTRLGTQSRQICFKRCGLTFYGTLSRTRKRMSQRVDSQHVPPRDEFSVLLNGFQALALVRCPFKRYLTKVTPHWVVVDVAQFWFRPAFTLGRIALGRRSRNRRAQDRAPTKHYPSDHLRPRSAAMAVGFTVERGYLSLCESFQTHANDSSP